MFYNRVNLTTLFAMIGIGVSLLLLGIGAQFMVEMNRYGNAGYDSGDMLAGSTFSLAGALTLLFSIALIMRLPWARIALQILLLLAGFGWVIFIIFLAADSPGAWFVLTGMAAIGLSGVIFGLLFLGNRYVLRDFDELPPPPAQSNDLLDH